MANSLVTNVLLEGSRNMIVSLAGVADTNDVPVTPVFTLASLKGNTLPNLFVGFKVKKIQYTGTPGLVLQLAWNSDSPQPIADLSTNALLEFPGDLAPNTSISGFDGTIIVSSRGFTPGYVYAFTCNLYLTKMYV